MWELRDNIVVLFGLLALSFCLNSCAGEESQQATNQEVLWEYYKIPTNSIAGTELALSYRLDPWDGARLLLESTLGSQLIQPKKQGDYSVFTIPEYAFNQAGTLNWKLIAGQNTLDKGSIEILPDTSRLKSIESYFGPTKLVAGSGEYAEFAVFPLDPFDNIMPEGTSVSINSFFMGKTKQDITEVQDGFALHRVYTSNRAGTVQIASSKDQMISKNRELNVVSAPGVDYSINWKARHNFADGNSIQEFYSSTILDPHGNIISDGTLVEFVAIDSKQNRVRFYGNTINGIAIGRTLHPEFPTQWKVQSFLSSGAQSQELELTFETAFKPFQAQKISKDEILEIGPVETAIGGMAADGVSVAISLEDAQGNTILQKEKIKDGYCLIDLAKLRKKNLRIISINIGGTKLDYNEVDK